VRLLHDIGAHARPGTEHADIVLSHLVCAYRLLALDALGAARLLRTPSLGLHPRRGREIGNFAIERMGRQPDRARG